MAEVDGRGELRLRIQEQFVSIQGEGGLVGTPSRFIRISGCNLRCQWCDSRASSWEAEGEFVEVEALLAGAAAGPRHVVVTGGEPLLFPAVVPLVDGLRAAGHHVTIETAGTVIPEGLQCDLVSISPKLSNSDPSPSQTRLALAHRERRFAPEVVRRLIAAADDFQLKYVVRPDSIEAELAEIDAQLAAIDPEGRVPAAALYLMPEGTEATQLERGYAALVPHCQRRGHRLGLRLHISLFGHRPGT